MANVTSDSLPLQLSTKTAEQPSANALTLKFNRKLGEPPAKTDKLYFANALPLPLSKPISEQPPPSRLPLTFNRKIGTLDGKTPTPIEPVEPPKPKRRMQGASVAINTLYQSAKVVANGGLNARFTLNVASDFWQTRQNGVNVGNPFLAKMQAFTLIANDISTRYGDYVLINNHFNTAYQNFVNIRQKSVVKVSDVVHLTNGVAVKSAKRLSFEKSLYQPLQDIKPLANGVASVEHGVLIGKGQEIRLQKSVSVPCRHYPIPEPPPKPAERKCDLPPPSSQLPLRFNRKRGALPSSALPLALTCWNEDSPILIPNLGSYLVHHTVTASVGGVNIDPIDFSIATDMSSFCWQGRVNLTAKQFAKIKTKLDVERGNEPMLIVNIDGLVFGFICEEISRNRTFNNYRYQISGRSVTARLGEDYAHSQGGTVNEELYSSQIVRQQLADTGITLDKFDVTDWLIPSGSYSLADKTPIAVIADIAKACGGVVVSDPIKPTLSILPKYKVPAWDLATATASLIVPADVIVSINDKKRTNPRYNTVTLIGQAEASEVYRERQGRERIAPIDNNALYSQLECVVAKGVQLLSDSGTHADYSLQLTVAKKYQIPLASVGEIWQIADPEGVFNGVITSVSLDVARDNDAVTVWQNVGIDRYLDV